MSKKVLVITGPTATGKTALGVALAKKLGGEVVSADSMQVYRRMDIGTAKVTAEEMQGVPHHMVDVADPSESFSVARYVEMASDCCEEIFARNRLPILVGGTGLYIDSLLSGRSFAERSDRENDIRNELNREYDERGGTAMWSELNSVDPERAERLSPNDRKRIVRALEIYRLTGKTITQHDAETQSLPPRYDSLMVALDYVQRDDLYARINRRVDQMLENGLVPEVQALLDLGLNDDHTAMQAIGYKEIVQAIRGSITLKEAVEQIKQESRRYAKRQLTWLRRNPDVCWLRWQSKPDLARAVVFLAFAFYIVSWLWNSTNENITTEPVQTYAISDSDEADGIVIRDEEVLFSSKQFLSIQAEDGKEISKGALLAISTDSEKDLEETNHLAELSREISRLETFLSSSASVVDASSREDNVASSARKLASAVATQDYEATDTAALDLSSLLFMQDASDKAEAKLNKLKAEQESYSNDSRDDDAMIEAPSAGIFTRTTDGFESTSSSEVTSISVSGLKDLMHQSSEPEEGFLYLAFPGSRQQRHRTASLRWSLGLPELPPLLQRPDPRNGSEHLQGRWRKLRSGLFHQVRAVGDDGHAPCHGGDHFLSVQRPESSCVRHARG